MQRRTMLSGCLGASLGFATGAVEGQPPQQKQEQPPKKPQPKADRLPRWRGFNLLDKFSKDSQSKFRESDFAWIAELGFNFVRLPMDYRCWANPTGGNRYREEILREIDEAVHFGEKHRIHVMLNFHRAPGYTVASPPEKKNLWTDPSAQRECAEMWRMFAQRYKYKRHERIENDRLSFNLFNEPAKVDATAHRAVVARMVDAVRAADPDRLIVCDGRDWGNTPPTELAGLGVAAATRGYEPFHLTHYRAAWVTGSSNWPTPTWPLREGGRVYDATTLKEQRIAPWKALEKQKVGVMVGEWGAHNRSPHAAVLPWMRDCLAAWKEAGWGWALWNFRGGFGVIDSGRRDVRYEIWRGHQLDREMLNVLQAG